MLFKINADNEISNLNRYTAVLNSNAVTKIVNLNGDAEILNLNGNTEIYTNTEFLNVFDLALSLRDATPPSYFLPTPPRLFEGFLSQKGTDLVLYRESTIL